MIGVGQRDTGANGKSSQWSKLEQFEQKKKRKRKNYIKLDYTKVENKYS